MRLVNDWLLVKVLREENAELAQGEVVGAKSSSGFLGAQILYKGCCGIDYKPDDSSGQPCMLVRTQDILCVLEEGPPVPKIRTPQPPPGRRG